MERIVAFLAFPVNLISALCWVLFCHYIWKNCKDSFILRFFLSPAATVSSILFFLLSYYIYLGVDKLNIKLRTKGSQE